MGNVELLAPAGNLEKLKVAFIYGADAVYFGGSQYGLRAFAGNFNNDEIMEAADYAISLAAKCMLQLIYSPIMKT
jgi:putative protease